jgi:hypothetical protein
MKALQKGWMLLAHAVALTVTLLAIFAWNSQKTTQPSLDGAQNSSSMNVLFAWQSILMQ